jgi:hypothetical protein
LPLSDLARHAAEDISPFLTPYVSFIGKFLAVMSVLFCWLPVFGLALGIAGVFEARKYGGGTMKWSRMGTVLSAVCTVLLVGIVVIGLLLERH